MSRSQSIALCSIALNAYAAPLLSHDPTTKTNVEHRLCAGGIFTFPLLSPAMAAHVKLSQPQLTTIALAFVHDFIRFYSQLTI